MANSKSGPWRPLVVLLAALLVGYIVMAVLGAWLPKLGLDLRGGTSITLTARPTTGQGSITKEKLQEASKIINNRVNGSGVTEASVTTQGENHIVVEVPGRGNDEKIVKLVGQTAQMRYRQVLAIAAPAGKRQQQQPEPTKSPEPSKSPQPTKSPAAKDSGGGKDSGAKDSGAKNRGRAASGALAAKSAANQSAADKTDKATVSHKPASKKQLKALAKFHCDDYKPKNDRPDQPLITCDRQGQTAFVLGPALMLGSDVKDATAGVPQNGVNWQVNLKLKDSGKEKFGRATKQMYQLQQPLNQFAIVLDGRVFSAPRVDGAITNGVASIYGDFTQAKAQNLANVLKYGALPLAFEPSQVSDVSPTLGSDSLRGGLLAGAIGLVLVGAYAVAYYRGLGLVAVASLAIAAAGAYAAVVLLGEGQGFTLTLAGIAGLIVAIGITADSFVVYFERLRDEIRDGKSVRSAVEAGWDRARRTILAADSISLLSAIVLYLLSVGSVRGFAYALGLTTLIDVVVVFMFTHPVVALLSRTRFFGTGRKFSGLNPESLGVPEERIAARSGRSRAARRPDPKEA